jgi:hypothetical protein
MHLPGVPYPTLGFLFVKILKIPHPVGRRPEDA